jgi:heme O synthase-like polyprenyltransferase
MGGFALAPGDFDWVNFGITATGTALCVAAANSYNQVRAPNSTRPRSRGLRLMPLPARTVD